jgi:DNA-binding GntR family transcriptional regulator
LLADHVYQYLMGQLAAHALPIDSHVNAQVIAEELAISRTTVNKAIARLIEGGFVRPDNRGRPIVVAYPSQRPTRKAIEFSFANQTEQTYEALLEGILRGHYYPGEILKERRLARELGVNPVTIHRAAGRLNSDGLLERRRRRGWQVVKLRVGNLREIYRIRLLLEPLGVPKAVVRLSEAKLDELEQETDRLIAQGEQSSVYERRQADYSLHRAIYEASGNRILGETLDPLIRKALLMTTVGFRYGRISRGFEEHKEIIQALRRRDPAEVSQRLKAHLKAAMTFNITAWKDGGDPPLADGS